MKVVLTIAGTDPSGAGIQADIKHCSTALCRKRHHSFDGPKHHRSLWDIRGPAEFVAKELACVFEDLPPHAVKIGMVSNVAIMEVIADA